MISKKTRKSVIRKEAQRIISEMPLAAPSRGGKNLHLQLATQFKPYFELTEQLVKHRRHWHK